MADAEALTRALGGRWHGHYGIAFCPAHHNARTPALSLSNGRDGQLLAHCFAGCDFGAVADALRARGLIQKAKKAVGSSFPAPRAGTQARSGPAKTPAEHSDAALRLWRGSVPIAESIAESYLRGRGITCELSDVLRYHPTCWHRSGQRLPALLALVDGADGFALHRTYLRHDGTGKAGVQPDKAMLGPCAGGAVRLSSGPTPLVVAEGIETGLSLICGLLREPSAVWAALSTSGVRSLRLPPEPGRLIVAPDGDPPGREAAHVLAERAAALGWAVSLLPAPDGGDWNDVLALSGRRA